jgi:hypothetical protein
MAGVKISELPALPVNTDLASSVFPVTLGGTTYKASGAVINAGFEIAASYGAISNAKNKRIIYVTADENNNGDTSLYIHDGTSLIFLLTIPS